MDLEVGDYYVKTKIQKNCRDFFKRIYDLPVNVELELIDDLKKFGAIEVFEFSKINPKSKDVYSIKSDLGLEIRGVVGDKSILLVIPKNQREDYIEFEEILNSYVREKRKLF